MLSNLSAQQEPPKSINNLTMTEIVDHMKLQFDPMRFVVRERFRFWSDMKRKPGETIQELAARIRQDAATCDFASIKNPLDDALRTRFICSVNNEAVLKALFKIKADELDFARAIEIATETEDAAKIAKETVYGSNSKSVFKVKGTSTKPAKKPVSNIPSTSGSKPQRKCYRCGKANHLAPSCPYKDFTCNFCRIKGHLEAVCKKKHVNWIDFVKAVPRTSVVPKLEIPIRIKNHTLNMELDTAAGGNFISEQYWNQLGKPTLQNSEWRFQSVSKHIMPILGTFTTKASYGTSNCEVLFLVSTIPNLNLLGRDTIKTMGISVDDILFSRSPSQAANQQLLVIQDVSNDDLYLQEACSKLCQRYEEVFKRELGCLKDVELEVEFSPDAKPIYCKPRPVPFAMREDLAHA